MTTITISTWKRDKTPDGPFSQNSVFHGSRSKRHIISIMFWKILEWKSGSDIRQQDATGETTQQAVYPGARAREKDYERK